MIEHARRGRRGWASGEKARPTVTPTGIAGANAAFALKRTI